MFRKASTCLLLASLIVGATASVAQSSREMITPTSASQLAELMRLGRGSAEVAAFAQDGSTLVVGGTVGLWLYDAVDLATESEPPLIATDGELRTLAVSPDGQTAAVSRSDGDIMLYDLESQTATQLLEPSRGSDNMVYSPDGMTLALNTGSNGILLLDVATGEEVRLEGSFRGEAEVAFSADGAWLAATGSDNSVYLWDVEGSAEGPELSGHTSTPVSISFSPDGTIVTGSSDRTIRLWDSATGTETANISLIGDAQIGRITQVVFSSDGSVFASGDSDGNMVLWNANDQSVIAQMAAGESINDLVFSADGSQLVSVSGEQTVHLWNAADGSEIAVSVGHTAGTDAVTFSPDSSTLVFSDDDENLWLWDTATMPELNMATRIQEGTNSSADNVQGIAYSSDGSVLAAVDSFSVYLYDTATNQRLHELDGDGIVDGLAFSPDDTLIVYYSSAGLYVFEVETGTLLASLETHNDWLNSVAWSPDQTLLATTSSDHTVRVYGIPPAQ